MARLRARPNDDPEAPAQTARELSLVRTILAEIHRDNQRAKMLAAQSPKLLTAPKKKRQRRVERWR